MKISFLILGTLSIAFAKAQQVQPTAQDSISTLNTVFLKPSSLFGSKYEAANRTGSSYYVSQKELAKYDHTDVNRVLLGIPGVNITEEDGFGLRPNISLRGTQADRSSKITIMEDGVLIAPAPYSAPAAYYFPNIARMEAVEVLKGSSQVQYGPFTTGGAINLVSSSITADLQGQARMNIGNYNSKQTEFRVSDSSERFGYVAEFLNFNSDGFKTLDGGGNTGFDRTDYSGKFRFNSAADAKMYQSLTLKLQYSEGVDNETYLGLTDDDFKRDPFRRYLASAEDSIDTEHFQIQLTHLIQPAKNVFITSTAYSNNFNRNWYKLNDVDTGNGTIGLAEILENPTTFVDEYNAIASNNDTAPGVFRVRANNRMYYSRGVQTKANILFGNTVLSNLEIGLRYHEDEEDRFQWNDFYGITNGRLALNTPGTPGTDANRVSNAQAVATHVLYKAQIGNWTVTPGLRNETIKLTQDNYGSNDVNRTGANLSSRENNLSVWIPGIGAHYRSNQNLSFFGGIHKGFSPPGSSPDVDEEESVNYELGTRFVFKGIRGEVTGFFNNYSNLLGSDLAASGGGGTTDMFNAGAAHVSGLELSFTTDLLENKPNWSFPVTLNYTFTNTSFQNEFESTVYGNVAIGDEIPYIAKNQWNILTGIGYKKWEFHTTARFVGAMRTQAGNGFIPQNQRVDSNFIVDASFRYNVNNHLILTSNIINLLDSEYAVSRQPAGLRPGHPFGINAGITVNI